MKPFWALYITVISPISVPVNVAIPSHVPTARPAPTKFVILPANLLTQKATATERSRYIATIPQSKLVKLVWPVALVRADSIRFILKEANGKTGHSNLKRQPRVAEVRHLLQSIPAWFSIFLVQFVVQSVIQPFVHWLQH